MVSLLFVVSCGPEWQAQTPMTAEEYLKAGVALTTADPCLAVHSLTCAINRDPQLAAAYKQRAIALQRLRNYEAAESDMSKVVELDGESPAILLLRAESQTSRGQRDEAITTLTHAIEIDPTDSLTYSRRAELSEANSDLQGAANDYTRALELDPAKLNWGYYHARRADLRDQLGDMDGALADFTEAIGHSRRNTFYLAEPQFRRGSLLYRKRAFKAALDDFRTAAASCRNRFGYPACLHVWLAQSMSGERSQADEDLTAILATDEADGGLNADTRTIVEFLIGKRSEVELLKTIDAPNSSDPDHRASRVLLVWFYAGMKRLLDGDQAGAVELLRKAAVIESKSPPPVESRWAQWELKRLLQASDQ